MTSTLPVQPESTEIESTETHDHAVEEHGDFRMFGLATFLVADAMTFAGFFAAYLTFKAVNPLPLKII
jgi:cytochrome c oxidase subunit 3